MSPIQRCWLLLPEKDYKRYVNWTSEEYLNPRYEFPYVAVLAPGYLRVRKSSSPKDNYCFKKDACENSLLVERLLSRAVGKRVRLGNNILV